MNKYVILNLSSSVYIIFYFLYFIFSIFSATFIFTQCSFPVHYYTMHIFKSVIKDTVTQLWTDWFRIITWSGCESYWSFRCVQSHG